jgi:hypothetical protein
VAQVKVKELEQEHNEASEKLVEAKRLYGCEQRQTEEGPKNREQGEGKDEDGDLLGDDPPDPPEQQDNQQQEQGVNQSTDPGDDNMEVDDNQTQSRIRQLQREIETLRAAATKRRKLDTAGGHTAMSPEQVLAEATAAAEAATKATEQVLDKLSGQQGPSQDPFRQPDFPNY